MRSLFKIIRREADDFPTLIARADAARDRRDWAVAASVYEAALAVRPDEASIWVQLGNMSKEAGNFARARRAYERALRLRPNDADAHLQMGHLQKLSGDEAEALASYALSNRLDPNNPSASGELRALQSPARPQSPPSSFSVPAQVPPAPQTAKSLRTPTARKLSFNARVLGAKNALQELLRPIVDTKLTDGANLDGARPAILEAVGALEKLLSGGLSPAGTTSPIADRASVSIVFDVSDLIQYFRHHRLPTGIQRVQIETISVILLRASACEGIHVCCFTEEDDYWREVPPDKFLELCELSLAAGDWTSIEWRELIEDVDDLMHNSADFIFNQGAYLVNIGTSWWLQNYFLKIREAKKRSDIRYIPFVHDMIPVMVPEYCVEGLVKDFVGWAQAVYYHADFYFVNSEATRADLIKVGRQLGYDVDPGSIRTVRLDADYRKSTLKLPDALGSLKQHRLAPGHYVLYVSTIEARKNHIGMFDAWYPSAGGRLFGIGGMIEGWGFRFRRVMGSVHKLDYGHKFAGSASAPVVARGAEAGDCCGLAGTGVIGIGGGTALRRECEPGFCLAQALSRTGQHISSSATGAGDGDAGSAVRALTGVDERVDRN
jgi:tetratricopeptide (TPR) repeat protein